MQVLAHIVRVWSGLKREFTKDFKTYEELLAILESRQLPARNRDHCLNALRRIGYYRLSAYWYPFRVRSADHQEGIDTPSEDVFPGLFLDDIVDAYELDRHIRHLLSHALDQIELASRVAIAYQMGQHERFAFENVQMFADTSQAPSHWDHESTYFDAFSTMLTNRQKDSKELFVRHFEQKYDGRLPVWASIETWDFGTLNTCFQILRSEDRHAISESLGLPGSRVLGSWLESFRVVRNMCAHHSRLNRRHFPSTPRFPNQARFSHIRALNEQHLHRLYPIAVAMVELVNNIGGDTSFVAQILLLSESFQRLPAVNARDYGFPDGWEKEEVWMAAKDSGSIE